MGPEALLKQKIKQKRHREGYDDGLSSSHKVREDKPCWRDQNTTTTTRCCCCCC
jgi:hypothetical protein